MGSNTSSVGYIYPMFSEPMITWVSSGLTGYYMSLTQRLCQKCSSDSLLLSPEKKNDKFY